MNRKITIIKQKGGARVFHVRRYSGEPTMHPRDRVHDYIQAPGIPPPKALYPLQFDINKPEAN